MHCIWQENILFRATGLADAEFHYDSTLSLVHSGELQRGESYKLAFSVIFAGNTLYSVKLLNKLIFI